MSRVKIYAEDGEQMLERLHVSSSMVVRAKVRLVLSNFMKFLGLKYFEKHKKIPRRFN